MKVFISLKMDGLLEPEIKVRLDEIKSYVSHIISVKLEYIDTYISDSVPDLVNPGIWYLGKSMEKLSEADLFVISRDDLSSRGCAFEYEVAKAYGIRRIII